MLMEVVRKRFLVRFACICNLYYRLEGGISFIVLLFGLGELFIFLMGSFNRLKGKKRCFRRKLVESRYDRKDVIKLTYK